MQIVLKTERNKADIITALLFIMATIGVVLQRFIRYALR